MSKRAFAVISVVALAASVVAGVFHVAKAAGEKVQQRLFQVVSSGQPEQFMELCHPGLEQEIDLPVLDAWMQAINTHLGEFQGLDFQNFRSGYRIENGHRFFESQGTVRFARGTAESRLVFFNDQLISFNVDSQQLPSDWFTGPSNTNIYQSRAKDFLTGFARRDVSGVHQMMHQALKDVISQETLAEQMAKISQVLGELEDMTVVGEQMQIDGSDQKLTIQLRLKASHLQADAAVTFQFVGLKGHLVAYDITPTEAN